MTGRKKPHKIEEIVEPTTQQKIDLMLDRNTLEFFIVWQGVEFRDKEASVVKTKAAELLKENRQLNWVPVICVLIMHKENQKNSSYHGIEAECAFEINRFYLAVNFKKEIKKVYWDIGADAPEESFSREEEAMHAFGDRPARYITRFYPSKAEIRLQAAENFMTSNAKGLIEHAQKTGEILLPYVNGLGPKRQPNEYRPFNSHPAAYLPYTEEMWNGLNKLIEAIRDLSAQLETMLLDEEGQQRIALVGANMIMAALPSGLMEE